PPGRGRPDRRVALDLRRSRLPGRRPGARVARGPRPGRVRPGHRLCGDGRLPAAVPHRGDHPRDRERARPRRGDRDRAGRGRRGRARPDDPRQPLRARGQGRRDGRRMVRPARRRGRGEAAGRGEDRRRRRRRLRGDGKRGAVSEEQTTVARGRRSAEAIDAALAGSRKALVVYLPVGYPTVEGSVAAARTAVAAGADVVELGLPYSDPGMDGEVIQRATTQALAQGTRVTDVLRAVEQVAATGAGVLVMTYYNPVLRYGVERFARDLASAGGAGLITPDLFPDEADQWVAAADAHDLDKVFLVAPSSTDERLAMTAAASRGFVYAASTMGVTGVRSAVDT